jgi:hypothetical protein
VAYHLRSSARHPYAESTVNQTLESAQYDTILGSAIATCLVDHVLPVEEMPAKLLEYAAHLHSLNGKPKGLHEQTGKYLGTIHSLLRKKLGRAARDNAAAPTERQLQAGDSSVAVQNVHKLATEYGILFG